jgi:transcriptional regulator with XRE-family HTH domain
MRAITPEVIELVPGCGSMRCMNVLTHTLPITLQQARKAKRLSQLELSMRVGVSQRHVSFVESGRAQPSRDLLIAWLQELDAPLVVRNAAMLQAGYAPVYSAAPLGDPRLAQANEALVQLMKAHDPQPAFVIDAQWNVVHLNRGGLWLALTLMPWAQALLVGHTPESASDSTFGGAPASAPINLLDMLSHPEGFTKHMTNLAEVGPALLAHLRDDASVQPALTPKVEAFAALLRGRLGSASLHTGWPSQAAPVLTSRFATVHGELAFFSMFTTFGTPQDITLASLRVEHMFAADEATRKVLQAQVI